MDEYSLVPRADAELAGNVLNEDELAAVQWKLWQLLARRVELYNGNDSSSVRTEIGEELFASVCFLLRLCLKEQGLSLRAFAQADAEAVFGGAMAVVRKKIGRGRRLYRALCLGTAEVESRAFAATLRALGVFLQQYDYRYFAHRVPFGLDYPLCCPVPGTWEGIEYVNEYLTRLTTENQFLCRFQSDDVAALMTAYCAGYRSLPVNLYEPVLANALGAALLRRDGGSLRLTPAEQAALVAQLSPLSRSQLRELLGETACALSRRLGMRTAAAKAYLPQTAQQLAPRLEAALRGGDVSRIFLSWEWRHETGRT